MKNGTQKAAGSVILRAQNGVIHMLTWVVFAIGWNFLTIACAIVAIMDSSEDPHPMRWFSLVLPFIGIFLAAGACFTTLRWMRFRKLRLHLDERPSATPGAFEAELALNGLELDASDILFQLAFMQMDHRNDEGRKVIWTGRKRRRTASRAQEVKADGIRIAFNIPPDIQTEKPSRWISTWYELTCTAEMPFPDLRCVFVIRASRG